MRRLIGLLAVTVGLALPAPGSAQSLVIDSSAVADSAVHIALMRARLPKSPLEAWTAERHAPDGVQLLQARQRRKHTPEEKVIMTGAVIGMAAGAVYAFNDGRHGGLAELGGLIMVPFGMLAGGAIGTGAGLVVCLAVCPRLH